MGLKRPKHLITFDQGVCISGGDSGRWWERKERGGFRSRGKKKKISVKYILISHQ